MFVDGFAPYLAGRAARPLAMRVTRAAPVAFALRPLAEACPGAFPAPDVVPSPLDFGVAPYGVEATRAVRVTNRAPFDLDALLGARTRRIPAGASVDLPLAWTPDGDAWSCETQTRDEAIRFVPADRAAVVAPADQTARVLETIRTGRATIRRAEPIDLTAAKGDRAREWTCPPDFVRDACRVDRAWCGGRPCAGVSAQPTATSCRFQCAGPCRLDAVLECRLRCPD